MSTVRIQVRRGTAAQWTSVNPVLAAGEMGLESDTNFIKFGDGTQNWNALGYANDPLAANIENTLADYVLIEDIGQPNGVASLNSSGKVPSDQIALVGPITMTGALTAGVLNAPTINATTTLNAVDANITGNLTVSGTTTSVNSTNLSVQDALIQVAKDNTANVLDVGIFGAFNDGTQQHTGLVKDATDGYWRLFSGVATQPTTTVNFSSYSKDNLELGNLSAESANIGDITNVELQYLNGVSSNVQNQLDGKASQTAFSDHASATTDVHGVIDFAELATQEYVDESDALLAPKESPTFTGTVSLPAGTSIGNVSSTEVGYLDGVTSAIQTQLNAKASSSSLSDHTSATTSIHGIANTADLATQSYVTNITDDLAPKASPTFTGTVAGITAAMVGLGDVDNTSDADKPVSTATQTALDDKLDLAGGTMTGLLTLSGAPTSDLHAATKLYVDGLAAGINFHQPVKATTSTNITTDYSNGTNGYLATLTAMSNGAIAAVDGVTLSLNDRILVRAQTDQTQNGIYTVTDLGSPSSKWVITRAADADNNPSGELATGDFCFVTSGTANGSKGFILSTTGTISIGTTNIVYSQFNASEAVIAGTNIEKDGATISVVDAPTFSGLITASSGVAYSDGTQTKEGVPSRTPIISKTGSYTLTALSERDSVIEVSSTSSTTITIPTNSAVAYPVGTSIDIFQINTGQVTIAGDSGVTVNATPGLKLRTQWSTATLFKRDTDTWIVYGDLMA